MFALERLDLLTPLQGTANRIQPPQQCGLAQAINLAIHNFTVRQMDLLRL